MGNGSTKTSDTNTFTGFLAQTGSSGTQQTGGWDDGGPNSSLNAFAQSQLEPLPAAVRVTLDTSGIVKKVGPQEYAVSLSLSQAQALQLVPGMADSLQNPSAAVPPNVFGYMFTSRNKAVATVSASGLVTPVSRGGVGILIGSPRAVNASFSGATPSGWSGTRGNVEGTYAELQVTVTP
jgi:hypothetical protein